LFHDRVRQFFGNGSTRICRALGLVGDAMVFRPACVCCGRHSRVLGVTFRVTQMLQRDGGEPLLITVK
jgi:hypothetical protein